MPHFCSYSVRGATLALLLVAGSAAWLFSLSCGTRPLLLGAVLPLTGEYAAYGVPMRQGIELAAGQVNHEGGVGGRQLELRIEDSGGDPQRAAALALELIENDQVPAIIAGGTSAEVLAMAPVASRYGRVLLSPSASSPLLSGAGKYIFRNYPSDALEGRVMADFAAFTLHAARVLVIASRNTYADGLRNEFSRAFESGQRSTETITFTPQKVSYSEVAADAASRSARVQAIYLVGYVSELTPLVLALRAKGVDRPILTTSAAASGAFLHELGVNAETIIFPRPSYDPASTDPRTASFVAGYEARYGNEPDVYAAHAYDAVGILAKIMAELGPRPDMIRRGLVDLRNYPGVSGATTFDENGDVVQPYQLCIIAGGRVAPLQDARLKVLEPLQRKVDSLRFGR